MTVDRFKQKFIHTIVDTGCMYVHVILASLNAGSDFHSKTLEAQFTHL